GGGGVMTRTFQSFQSNGRRGDFGSSLAALSNSPTLPMRGSSIANTVLIGFNATRQRDKYELVQLNDKFAQNFEKLQFFKAQNRILLLKLEALRSHSEQ
ncbi:unnamed protein product, partial [Rotaria sp. Silwood2]